MTQNCNTKSFLVSSRQHLNWRLVICGLLPIVIGLPQSSSATEDLGEMLDDDYVLQKNLTTLPDENASPAYPAKEKPTYSLSGIGQVTLRNSELPTGESDKTFRGQIRLDGWIGLGESNCFKLQARLSTGSKYNSESFTFNMWNGRPDFNIAIRRLYIDTNCVRSHIRLQVGSAPSDGAGKLGLSNSGWIDGARVIIDDTENNRKYTLSFGSVSNLTTPNIFERQYSGFSYAQVEALQVLNGGHDIFASVVSHKDNMYTRLGIKWAISEYLTWLQNFRGEVLFLNSKGSGYYLGAEAPVEKWRVNAYIVNLDPSLEKSVDATLVINSFYGLGRNAYFELTRPLDENWTFYFRNREGQAGRKTETGVNRKF